MKLSILIPMKPWSVSFLDMAKKNSLKKSLEKLKEKEL